MMKNFVTHTSIMNIEKAMITIIQAFSPPSGFVCSEWRFETVVPSAWCVCVWSSSRHSSNSESVNDFKLQKNCIRFTVFYQEIYFYCPCHTLFLSHMKEKEYSYSTFTLNVVEYCMQVHWIAARSYLWLWSEYRFYSAQYLRHQGNARTFYLHFFTLNTLFHKGFA